MIINADSTKAIRNLTYKPRRLVYLDPPDNIGLQYNGYKDSRSDYYEWLIRAIADATAIADVVWVSYYYKHDQMLSMASLYWGMDVRKIMWVFTFGQYNDKGLANGYRPQMCLSRQGYQLNYDAIRVVSERMLLGDKRAAGLRVPDDVWQYPRIVGNHPERRAWHPTQHPEELIERTIKLSGCDNVIDMFAGTGTVERVCKKLNLECYSYEIDPEYCKLIDPSWKP